MKSGDAKRLYDRERYRKLRDGRRATRAPDALSKLSDIDRAYLAGLIDGEGSIYCAAFGSERKRSCYPAVAIGMTDEGVIRWVADTWGVKVSYVLKRKNPNWKPQYFVRLSGKRAQLLCIALLPFLKVKRRQAELVLTFPCDARIAPGKKIEGTEINQIRFRLRDEINALNGAPRNKNTKRGGGLL